MNPTKNDLPGKTRERIIKLVIARLADASDLYSQSKRAYWNVKGSSFIALHELFDDVASVVLNYVDLIAERAVQLRGSTVGTVRPASAASSLSEYPIDISDGYDHGNALTSALASFGHLARRALNMAA